MFGLPSFAKVVIAFCAILVFYRMKLPLGVSIMLSAVGLTLWTGAGSEGIRKLLMSAVAFDNLLLYMVVFLLLLFTTTLNATGRMKRTVDALEAWLSSKRMLFGGLPALVGLLPMPGGALFSAPLIDSIKTKQEHSPEFKAILNYWFRHIWEYWWPLYPGVILAITYSHLPAATYLLMMMPVSVAAIFAGWYFILRKISSEGRNAEPVRPRPSEIAATVSPIFILVLSTIAGSILLPHLGLSAPMPNLIGMIAGLFIAFFVLFRPEPALAIPTLRKQMSANTMGLVVVILGVQMFAATLKMPIGAGEMTLVSIMQDELFAIGIPLVLVIAALPFVAGMVTGVAVGFVGASFPLVFGLLGPQPPLNILAATTMFAYGFGYAGMLLSPVHICLVVTVKYFNARLLSSYAYLVRPVILVLAASLLFSGIYYKIL